MSAKDSLRNSHNEAMEIAEEAFLKRHLGEEAEAIQLFAEAYHMEITVAHSTVAEPSRSVLFRSAATLALHANLLQEAEKAVAYGLTGDPPVMIADELRDVYERINFQRHLSLKGVTLAPNELQMTLAGNSVAPGMALIDVVFDRVEKLEKIITRTAQRIYKRPFGSLPKSSEFYDLYISTPREGSFAVTLRLGEPLQPMLPGIDDRANIIEEVLYNLDLLNRNDLPQLRHEIPDNNYYLNFVGLAKEIAPDGDSVKLVGLTALRDGVQSSVEFSLTSKDLKPVVTEIADEIAAKAEEEFSQKPVTFRGELLFADALNRNIVKLRDISGNVFSIEVSEAIVEDVVQPFFGKQVQIDAMQVGEKKFKLRDISLWEE